MRSYQRMAFWNPYRLRIWVEKIGGIVSLYVPTAHIEHPLLFAGCADASRTVLDVREINFLGASLRSYSKAAATSAESIYSS